jgi:hypothetical protein
MPPQQARHSPLPFVSLVSFVFQGFGDYFFGVSEVVVVVEVAGVPGSEVVVVVVSLWFTFL